MLLLLLVVTTGIRCGNEGKNDVAVKGMEVLQAKPFSPDASYVPAFYLDRRAFLQVDDSITKYKDKLVLQFEPNKKEVAMAVYTIADNDKNKADVSKAAVKERIVHPKPFANALKLPAAAVQFANQRTKEDEYQKLLTEVKKYPFINYVIFVPEVEDDHIRFKITGVEKLPHDLMATGFATGSYYSRSF